MREQLFDGRIYVRYTEIDPARTTLLFVHGLSGSSSAWVPYEEYFRGRYNTVAIDLRGHGRSYKPPHPDDYSLFALADDVYRIIVELQLGPVVLISHSLGTLVGLYLLHSHPQLFSKVVFIGANYHVKDMWRSRTSRPFTALIARINRSDAVQEPGIHIDYAKYRNTGDWDPRRMRADIGNTGLRSYIHCLNTTYDFAAHDWWKEISVPTLIIHGARDTLIPVAHAKRLAADIPHARLVVLPDANHVLVINNIERAEEAIGRFLEAR